MRLTALLCAPHWPAPYQTRLSQPLHPMRPMKLTRPLRPSKPVSLVRPEWLIRLKPTRPLCLSSCHCCSCSPSQNIPQSLRKWRDVLKYLIINFKAWFAGLFWIKNRKRFCAFSAIAINEPIWAWSKRLSLFIVALLAPVLAVCKKHSTSLIAREDAVAELILMVNPLYRIMCVAMLNYKWCLALRSVLGTSGVWPK